MDKVKTSRNPENHRDYPGTARQGKCSHYPSLFSSVLFILGALLVFGIALVMAVTALTSLFTRTEVRAEQTVLLVAFGFEGLVLLAAAFFAFQKFLQKSSVDAEVSISISNWQIAVLVIIAAASILIGYQIGGIQTISWIFLPVLTIPAVVFPLGVLLAVGTRNLPVGTRWQTWSVLGLGMTLAPILLFTLEIFAGLVIVSVVVAYVVTQPALSSELQSLSQQIMILGPQSEATLDLLSPLFTKPGVIVTALIYMAVLVPAIEELFKPIGVWLLAGRLESPAQGFTLGALSGAGYGLIETIGVSGQTGEWASLLFTRIGTGLLHITTSALMGGAIVLVWRERRYLRWIGTYLLAVLLHGLWNTLALLFSFSSIAEVLEQPGRLSSIQPGIIIGMSLLAIVLFGILVISNRRMRKTIPPLPMEPTVPGESMEISETM
ncbi:MAG: PrsW family intramembrane metalloprotease [Chloroflexi bacterium]|nr:MAG: PrsW family intramembrane metalloprotease [Chloroflexota bacterium]